MAKIVKIRYIFSLLSFCFFVLNINATTNVTNVAGHLSEHLNANETSAVIKGYINGTDVKYLRDMILNHSLSSLDISASSIVSGGDAYYKVTNGGAKESYTTTNNVIGKYMFYQCSQLKKLILPENIVTIDERAICYCSELDSITIPNSVMNLMYLSLGHDSNLKKVNIGKGITDLATAVFWNDYNLKNVYMYTDNPPTCQSYIFSSTPAVHIPSTCLNSYEIAWKERTSHNWNCTFVADIIDSNDMKETNENLLIFFSSAACTSLKATYANMTDAKLKEAMSAKSLSEDLQNIAVKIKNNTWNKYEKKFRIHSYNAYSDANYWASKLATTGLSYMGNPTGIYANKDEDLYVFVEGDIPDGAALYISACSGNELIKSATTGWCLRKGLNVIHTQKDNSIFYVLYTADTSDLTKNVSVWPSMNIHIEGGKVNGYYDKSDNDDAEFLDLVSNANYDLFTVKGDHGLFNFKTDTYKQAWPKTIARSIDWYDKLAMWEFNVIGICDDVAAGKLSSSPQYVSGGESFYPSFCNNPIFAIQGDATYNGWANSSTYRTAYNSYKCIESAFNVERADFDSWCAAHECGHNSQKAINLEGCTEVSNNLFSNIATYLTGYKITESKSITSEDNSIAREANDYMANTPYVSRNIWSMTRMYFQLYLYYHLAQKNTAFYPTLFKELRADPMTLWKGGNLSTLKFVEKVCEVANEDLTDFFSLWGFFVPCSNVEVYDNYFFSVSQSDIDATKAKIAKYPRKNREIMFIEDRIKPMTRTDIWANGETRVDYVKGMYGNLGQFSDYLDVNMQQANYTCKISNKQCILTGSGGVGFIVYDKDDKIATISNCTTFQLPDDFNTDYKICAIDGDGTFTCLYGQFSGIEQVTSAPTIEHDNKIYDLNGRVISTGDKSSLKHGVYIINGKKYCK